MIYLLTHSYSSANGLQDLATFVLRLWEILSLAISAFVAYIIIAVKFQVSVKLSRHIPHPPQFCMLNIGLPSYLDLYGIECMSKIFGGPYRNMHGPAEVTTLRRSRFSRASEPRLLEDLEIEVRGCSATHEGSKEVSFQYVIIHRFHPAFV